MAITLNLPLASGIEKYVVNEAPANWRQYIQGAPQLQAFNRIAYSAAHVVADPLASHNPWVDCRLDWDATIHYRRHLWSLGMGVAEAMDTAQRGMGLDWNASLELIGRSIDASRDFPNARIASGCGTDQLAPSAATTIADVMNAYEEQMAAVEKLSGRLIIMASRALASIAKSADDYHKVYGHLLRQAKQPVILHWLGDMFDPALKGYWGSASTEIAMSTAIEIIQANVSKVDGIKISLLDKDQEIAMRRRLPAGVRMYTGDDFNYAELIAGDAIGEGQHQQQSDALLGIFDAIAPAANAALSELSKGNTERFHEILAPTVPLSRHIFETPTRFYKTGVVFMAWLNGHQKHFTMVAGQQSTRSILHLSELFRLADRAGLLDEPAQASLKFKALLATHGVAQ
jgi:Protein of unknown function (DUF993)